MSGATLGARDSVKVTTGGNISSFGMRSYTSALVEINRNTAILLLPVTVYILVIFVVGVLGNMLCIYIYGWKWQNNTTRVFFLGLAALDLTNCIINTPVELYIMIHFYYFPDAQICRISVFVINVLIKSSSGVFIAIAIDRYIRICHPQRRPISIFGAKISIVLSLCISAGLSWPDMLLYGNARVTLQSPYNSTEHIEGVICDLQDGFHNTFSSLFVIIYMWWELLTSVIILASLYVAIGRTIRKRSKRPSVKFLVLVRTSSPVRCKAMAGSDTSSTMESNKSTLYEFDESTQCGSTAVDQSIYTSSTVTEEQNGEVTFKRQPPTILRKPRLDVVRSIILPIVITSVFIISFLPMLVVVTLRYHIGPQFYPSLSPTEQFLFSLFARSYLVKNSINPIVYGMYSTQFRNRVRSLLHIPTVDTGYIYSLG